MGQGDISFSGLHFTGKLQMAPLNDQVPFTFLIASQRTYSKIFLITNVIFVPAIPPVLQIQPVDVLE